MKELLTPLLQLQRFFLPTLLAVLAWAIWRTVWRKDLAVGLALFVGLVIFADGFYNTGIYLPGMEKGSIRYSELCAAYLLWVSRPSGTHWRTVSVLIGAYFTFLFLSAVRNDPMLPGVSEFRGIIFPQIIGFAIARRGFARHDDYRRFVLHVTSVVLVIGIFDFWDVFFDRWLLHSETLNTGKYFVTRQQGRFGSVFLNPNMLGAFTVLVFPIMFIRSLNETDRWCRLYLWAGLLALLFCLVETQSRGPMLALGCALVLLAIGPCGAVTRTRRLSFLAGFALLVTLLMPGFLEHAMKRFDEVDREMSTEDARTRETVWLYARRMIADNPVFGVGFGEKRFVATIDTYGFRDKYGQEPLDNPHNSYLQMTVYAGFPALVAFLLANGALLWRAGRLSVQSADDPSTPTVFGVAVGVTAFLASAYPDMHLFTNDVGPTYWVFCGLLFSLGVNRLDPGAKVAPLVAPASQIVPPAASFTGRGVDRLRYPADSSLERAHVEALRQRGGRLPEGRRAGSRHHGDLQARKETLR